MCLDHYNHKNDEVNGDRHVCIHTIPVIHGLMLELYKGLAEHLLLELNTRVKSQDIEDVVSLQNDIHFLSIAAKKIQKTDSIYQMLKQFSVGTDYKKSSPGISDPFSLKPFQLCKIVSPVKMVKYIIDPKIK